MSRLLPERPLRVVVDTSTALPILLLRHPPPHWLAQLWNDRTIALLATNETLAELREKLIERSPVTGDNQVRLFLRRTLGRYEALCEIVPAPHLPDAPQCRDATDQKFIDLATAADADFILARDPDLTVMDPQPGFRIIHDIDDHHVFNTAVRDSY